MTDLYRPHDALRDIVRHRGVGGLLFGVCDVLRGTAAYGGILRVVNQLASEAIDIDRKRDAAAERAQLLAQAARCLCPSHPPEQVEEGF